LAIRPARLMPGEVRERLNRAVSKTVEPLRVPWVRIPPSPPEFIYPQSGVLVSPTAPKARWASMPAITLRGHWRLRLKGGRTLRALTEASVREDPSRRRVHPPSRADRLVIMLVPMNAPEIRAIFHGDFSPVNVANPARPDEVLIAAVTGLGPTRPGVDPGSPFPAAPPEFVNSPVEVAAAGKPTDVVNKVGWPGTKDVYRFDFRMPGDVSGEISIQVTVAWITGLEFRIPVR
jgi:hypothetical protein